MICFHHNDSDGRAAGAIVHKFFKGIGRYVEIDYKDNIPVPEIKPDEKIIIVDFSFKPEIMEKVLKITEDITWIDHHETAFKYRYSKEIRGLRSNDAAACELAWKYFYKTEAPRAVKLIGDRDTWALRYGHETMAFNAGLLLHQHKPGALIWQMLLSDSKASKKTVEKIKIEGEVCLEFRRNILLDYANRYGFETGFEGCRCFAMGIHMFGSETFAHRFEKYDICLSFEFVGDKWVVGLYSAKVNVAEIAEKYGGGGHTGAAGFECNELPFRKIKEGEQ